MGRFAVDFLIAQPRLVVEVEGPFHDTPQASKHDRERMNYLNNLGYRVLRFSSEQVSEDPDAAAQYILTEARRTPVGTDSPPLDGTKRVRRILVENQTDEGETGATTCPQTRASKHTSTTKPAQTTTPNGSQPVYQGEE